jgi:hypothetical protein
MPHLFSFDLNQDITLSKGISIFNEASIYDMFYLPVSMVASAQCDELLPNLISHTNILNDDLWGIEGCKNGFSSRKVYALLTTSDKLLLMYSGFGNHV